MDVRLVIVKEFKLLSREVRWFKCHFEAMSRFKWSLNVPEISSVDLFMEVESIFETCFLSGQCQSRAAFAWIVPLLFRYRMQLSGALLIIFPENKIVPFVYRSPLVFRRLQLGCR